MQRWWNDESGGTAIEYALLLAFCFLAFVGSASLLSPAISNLFSGVISGFGN